MPWMQNRFINEVDRYINMMMQHDIDVLEKNEEKYVKTHDLISKI